LKALPRGPISQRFKIAAAVALLAAIGLVGQPALAGQQSSLVLNKDGSLSCSQVGTVTIVSCDHSLTAPLSMPAVQVRAVPNTSALALTSGVHTGWA
jgi:hypothetical protein